MPPPIRVLSPLEGVFWWEVYSEEHRVHLGACAVLHGADVIVIDPLGPPQDILSQINQWSAFHPSLSLAKKPTAILLTNGNHERASKIWSETFQAPVYATDQSGLPSHCFRPFHCRSDTFPLDGWHHRPLDGGGPGESVFFVKARSLAIFGDALVNLPNRGLELLPAKYCSNSNRLLDSLVRFVEDTNFHHALMAHGTPLLVNAREQISALLSRRTAASEH